MKDPMKGRTKAPRQETLKGWRAHPAALLPLLRAFALPLLFAAPAAAQPELERLPDLTPRAFEIRGDLQISLPNLERQPLRGFAPPPRTYVVPADRRTFVAPYRQALDGLPADPLAEPAPPQIATLNPLTGRIDAGFGRYASRLGRLTVSRGGFGVNAAYSGFSGFEPFDERPGLDAGSDTFDGRVAYTSPGPARFGFDVGGDYARYRLIGAAVPQVFDPQPERSARTVDGGVSVSSARPRAPFGAYVRFASTEVSAGVADDLLDSGVPEGSFDQTETRFEGGGTVRVGRLRLGADGALSGLGGEGLGASLVSYSAGAVLRLAAGRGQLEVGARLLGYGASPANGGGSSTLVAPVVRFETPLSPTARLYLRTEPRVERRGLAGLFRENPYAEPEPFVAPDLHLIDGEGGVEVQRERVRFTAYGGLRLSPVTLYFERETTGLRRGLYLARYSESVAVRGGGSVTLIAPGGLRVTAGAEARAAMLDPEQALPYFAPLVGHLSLALPFAGGRGLLQVTGSAESRRPAARDDADADAWATLDAEAHYGLGSTVGLLVRGERLAGRAERWPGFPRPPAAVLAGLRFRW